MCTTISDKTGIGGSGKGATGWFELDHVYIGYDHPYHAPLDHALSLDFVNEAAGPGARVAVELDRESARALAHRILETLELADAYEDGVPTRD
jgi:hypothetical protein